MQSLALTLALALTAPVDAPPAPDTPRDTLPIGAPTAEAGKAPSPKRVWGVALLAGGSAALAVTATGAALIEALARPDDRDKQIENPELLQGISFGTMLLGATSIAALLAGGALVVAE